MKIAAFCDRCEAQFYEGPTLRLREWPVSSKAVSVEGPLGHSAFQLCEECAVELREWIEEGRPADPFNTVQTIPQ